MGPLPLDAEIWGIDRRNYYTKIVRSYLDAFAGLGYRTALVHQDALLKFLSDRHATFPVFYAPKERVETRPRAVFDINFSGATAKLTTALGIAYVAHVWDVWAGSPSQPPRMEHYLPNGLDYVFTFSRGQVPVFRRIGVRHAEHLHACADLATFRPVPLAPDEKGRYGADVSFYATPGLADGSNGYRLYGDQLRAALASAQQQQRPLLEKALGAIEKALVEQEKDLFRYRLPEILKRAEEEAGIFFVSQEPTARRETVAVHLSLEVSVRQRLAVARILAPLGISLWGPEEWKSAAAPGAVWKGPADFTADIPRIASGSRINLNVPKCHALDAVNPRVFEVMACGGFMLTSPFEEGVLPFEEGRDLDVFRTCGELREKAAYYLAHEDERRRIAESGMEKTRAAHGFEHRARRIAEVLAADGRLKRSV